MKENLWTRDFLLLIFANAFSVCSFQLLFPTLPLFLAEHGNSSQEIGIVMGIFTSPAILVRPFSAKAARAMGKKRTLHVGFIISLIAISTYILGVTFTSALVVRLIHGVGFGIASTLLASVLGDLVPGARRGEGIGYLGFGVAVISSSAPFIGLWIYNQGQPLDLFIVSGSALLISLLLTVFISTSKLVETYTGEHSAKRGLDGFFERTALFPAFLTFLLGICFGSVMSFMALFGKEHHIDNVGWFFFSSTCGSFLARMISGRIFDRKGASFVIVPGTILGTAGLILLSQAYSVWLMVVSALLYGLGTGTLVPSLQAWVMNRVHPERRTEASAMFYNSFDTGIGGGSALLGFLASVSSYSFMYLISALVMFAILVIYSTSQLRLRRKAITKDGGA